MSLPRYPEYKDSGVSWLGEVPAHWEIRRLGFFFEERRQKVSDKEYLPLSVTKNGIVPQLETAAKTDDGDNRKKVCEGDYVINSRSDRKGSSGMAVMGGSVSLINTVLRPLDGIDIKFAHHLFRSVLFQEEYYRYGKGIVADLWSTNYSEMRNISLALPRVEEQVQIAIFLDRETAKIDALIAKQEKLIALLAEKRQATISRAVTRGLDPNVPLKDSGVPWLGKVPAHWEVCAVRRILSKVEQGWSPECENRPAEDGEWGVLKAGCVNRGIFDPQENKALPNHLQPVEELMVKAGDLLMSRASGSPQLVGSVAYISDARFGLMLSDKIFRLYLTANADPKYFAWQFNSKALRTQIERAISGADGLANNLPQSSMKEFSIAKPPVDEQRHIAAFLEKAVAQLEMLSAEASKAILLLKERRAALISAAVTGKIDVRGLAA